MRIDLPEGYVDFGREGKNEVDVVSTTPGQGDPPKLRQGATHGGGLAAWSINRVRADGRHEEVGLIQGKEDERYPGALAGEITVHLRKPNADGDASMVPVLTLRHDGAALHVPTATAPSTVSSRFYSQNRRYCTNFQDDGHIVQYDTHGSLDETTWTAVWSNWHGRL